LAEVVTFSLFSGSMRFKILATCGYPDIVKLGDSECLDFFTPGNSLYKGYI
jgi:hypothetical protein